MADAMSDTGGGWPADEAPLRAAERASREAHELAARADPLGDGSYAGDASKAPLIDTPDLEAHDHALAGKGVIGALRRAQGAKMAEPGSVQLDEPFDKLRTGSGEAWHAPTWAPHEHDDIDPAAERRAEADAQAREAAWARAQGVRLPEDDGL